MHHTVNPVRFDCILEPKGGIFFFGAEIYTQGEIIF